MNYDQTTPGEGGDSPPISIELPSNPHEVWQFLNDLATDPDFYDQVAADPATHLAERGFKFEFGPESLITREEITLPPRSEIQEMLSRVDDPTTQTAAMPHWFIIFVMPIAWAGLAGGSSSDAVE